MVNISYLQNLTPLEFNNSVIDDPLTIIPDMVANTNTLSQGYWGLGVMTVIFVFFIWVTFKTSGDIRFGFLRSVLVSSGFTSLVGLIAIVSGLFTSYIHVLWFINIFIISVVLMYFAKRQGA